MTRDELRGIIEGITDEQLKKILDINSSDIGKTKKAAEDMSLKLEAANLHAGKLEEELSALRESQCEADEMKQKLDELQKVIDEKRVAEEAEKKQLELEQRFGLAAEGAAFINDFTRAGVLEKFKSALLDENNVGKADSEIFGQITTGMENIFVPQNEVPTVVASTTGFGETLTDGEVRQIMGLMV